MIDRTSKSGNGEPGRRRPTKAQVAYANGKIDAALAMIEARLRPPPPAPPTIWCIDRFGTWDRTADPVPRVEGMLDDAQRERAGYYHMACFGPVGFPVRVEVFRHERDGTWLADVEIEGSIEPVLLADFPALWLFLTQAAGIVQMGRAAADDF